MKILKIFLVTAALLMLTSFCVYAEENEFYIEQYEKSGAADLDKTLPDNTREFFSENGIDPSDYGWVNSVTAEGVFSHIFFFLKSGARAPLKAGGGIVAIILISAALSSADIKGSVNDTALFAAVAGAALIIALPIAELVNASANALKGIGTFMLSFVPIFAVILAASGGTVSSVTMSAVLLSAAEGVTYVSSFAVVPLMGAYLAISISSAVSPVIGKSGLAALIKKMSLWITAFISTVFVGVLGIQTTINSSSDSIASKTVKFVIGTSVPVAGGLLSEAVGTVTASMGLLKSSVGIYGVIACAVILLPFVAELIVWRAVLLITSAVSDIFDLPQISGLLRAVDSVLTVLLGILLITGAMFIISLSVVITGVRPV